MACKVSVVIPMYNVEEYLEECLESVLAQTIDGFEIICVDDGSTDSTRPIAESYCSRFENIKLLVQENAGAAVARNRAIDAASGEYIAFMDPDDWYPHENVLRTLYSTAKRNKAMICGGSLCEYIKGKGITTSFKGPKSKCSFDQDGFVHFSDYQFDYYYQRFIFQRDFLNQNRLRFPEYRRFQDPPFFINSMIAAGKFYAIRSVTYCYRVNSKPVQWTEEKLTHLALGLGDVLKATSYHQLKELHLIELQRVNTIYYERFEEALTDSAGGLSNAIERLCDYADLSLASEDPELDECVASLREQIKRKRILDCSACEKVEQESHSLELKSWIECFKINKANPKISIVIPAFNCEQYIEACIRSVRKQSYHNLEIVIIDDGSTDRTLEVAHRASAGDHRIIVLSKENGGLSSSRNAGLDISSGEYVLFLDSDDLLGIGAISLLAAIAFSASLDCLMFGAEAFFEDRESLRNNPSYRSYYERHGSYNGVMDGRSCFVNLVGNGDYKPSACLQMLKRSFLIDNDIRFIEGILNEDNAFTLEVLHRASRVFVLDAPLYKRRVRGGSIMTSGKSVENAYGYFNAVQVASTFTEEGDDGEFYKALREECSLLVRNARTFSRVDEKTNKDLFSKSIPLKNGRLLFDCLIADTGHSQISSTHGQDDECKVLEAKLRKCEKELSKIKGSRSYKLSKKLSKIYQAVKRAMSWKRGSLRSDGKK